MLLHSTEESVRRGRPSLLAIIETIAATGFSIWLAWKQNSLEHIVIATALTPFLLLRTRLSTWYTIRVFFILFFRITSALPRSIYTYVYLGICSLIPIIKIICTIRVFLRKPLYSIKRIPINFYMNIFVIDAFKSPQMIPGSEEINTGTRHLRGLNIYNLLYQAPQLIRDWFNMKYTNNLTALTVLIFLNSCILILFFCIAVSFRVAVKSTALIWLPLLWVIYQSQYGIDINDRIRLNIRLPWTKLMLVYSSLIVLGFLIKILFLFTARNFTDLNWLGPLGVLATRLVAPLELPLWQLATAINGILAWALYFRAKRHVLAMNSTEALPAAWLQREYVAFQAVRTTLSLYAIACTFYIAAATAWVTEWPPIRFILFPWTASSGP